MYFILLIVLAINSATHTAADKQKEPCDTILVQEGRMSIKRSLLIKLMPNLPANPQTIDYKSMPHSKFLECLATIAVRNDNRLISYLKLTNFENVLKLFRSSLSIKYRNPNGDLQHNRLTSFAAQELARRLEKNPALSRDIDPNTIGAIAHLAPNF